MKTNLTLHKFWRVTKKVLLILFLTSIFWTFLARFLPVYLTPLMVIRSVESVFDGEVPKNSKRWVPIDKISNNMVRAVIASEDNTFMSHFGFSFTDMQKAFKYNLKGKKIRGGSTISQQTAKNVFLWNSRSYVRKVMEGYFTVLIEVMWPKKRIMEVYLNVIEMGDGIYGIEAASLEYFGKNASDLSKSEAAAIAVCLPNPRKFSPVHPSSYLQRRKAKVLNLMGKLPLIDMHNN